MDNVFGTEILTVKCPIMDFMWLVIDISMARPPDDFTMDSLTKVKYNKEDDSVEIDIKKLTVIHLEAHRVLFVLHKHGYLPIAPPFIIGLKGIEVQRTEEIIRFYVKRIKT